MVICRAGDKTDPMTALVALIDSDKYAARGLALLLEDIGCRSVSGDDAEAVLENADARSDIRLIIAEQRLSQGRDGLTEALTVRAALGWAVPIIVLAARLYILPATVGLLPDIQAIYTPVDIPVLLNAISGCITREVNRL
jgi:DNA-binding response OmpR family regulator